MDNHLEKLLEGIFSIKISIPNNEERYRESLGVALSTMLSSSRYWNIMVNCRWLMNHKENFLFGN